MKRISFMLTVMAIVGILGACTSLKPFTQDELDRLSTELTPPLQTK